MSVRSGNCAGCVKITMTKITTSLLHSAAGFVFTINSILQTIWSIKQTLLRKFHIADITFMKLQPYICLSLDISPDSQGWCNLRFWSVKTLFKKINLITFSKIRKSTMIIKKSFSIIPVKFIRSRKVSFSEVFRL